MKLLIGLAAALAISACAAVSPAGQSLDGASPFSAETAFPHLTSDPYGRRASGTFPDDPVGYTAGVLQATSMVHEGECETAAPLLEQSVAAYPDDGDVWAMLGWCRAQLEAWRPAITAYTEALALGVTPWDLDANPNDIMVEIAAAYAQAGGREDALAWLRRGLEARFDERPAIAEAPEAASLLSDPGFARLAGLAPDGERSRDEEWRYDIAFLRDQVLMLHADPDHHSPAVALDRSLSELSRAVPDLNDEQIVARLDLFIGMLGAGHDLFFPVVAERGGLMPFALKVYLFTDGLHIIDAYDPGLIGTRIDRFGETPTGTAYEAVARAFPGDNDMEARWMAARHLMQAYTLEALGIVEDAQTATLTVTDRSGVSRTITPERRPFARMSPALEAPADITAPLYLSRLDEPYWTARLDDLEALYVQLNEVSEVEDGGFAAFAERMRAEAAVPGVTNLILDLRHSAGGNGYLTPPLVRQLIAFDASPEKGELYIVIGRNTFSASQNLITDLDRLADPVFVGEPSGSRPNAISESGHFTLPFSGLSGMLASQLHQTSWPEDHRIWIAPDAPVGLSSTDYFAGRDPALDVIEDLIEAQER